ncbi:MAG: OmpH family outer membrane protein [Bacteroidales bacterium]|nr:OmpH family outer membrane protein [Bacteroidales bacterium]MBN2819405.1 OmpH family outer membrane protein [Bacteroidales bacterium]
MKSFKTLIALVAVATFSLTVSAQLKIGHINSQELMASMPETDSAQKKLEQVALEHDNILEEMSVELNKKYEDYLKKLQDTANPMSELVRANKESELQELQERMQTFQQNAEQDIQRQRMALFQPIQEKAIKAVNDVAAENGFTYILDIGAGAVVYTAPGAEDILPLVKNKLGILE